MVRRNSWLMMFVVAGVSAGCGQGSGPAGGSTEGKKETRPATTNATANAEGKKYLLPSVPAGAKGVIEVRKQAKDGDEVVIAGRVGGSTKPFTEGRASFLIVDPSMQPAQECDCPWDYCELPKEELSAARASVKFVDGEGKSLHMSARELFGIKELTHVVVKGKASRDEKGNLSVVANGIFVVKDKE